MAKKQTKRKTSRKRLDDKDPSKYQTGEAIVGLWHESINKGLSGLLKDKTLADEIPATRKAKLIAIVQKRLDGTDSEPGKVFTKDNEKRTKQVANDLGKICRMLTTIDDKIPLTTFDAAFDLVKDHHDICRGPRKDRGGAQDLRGVWCEGGGG